LGHALRAAKAFFFLSPPSSPPHAGFPTKTKEACRPQKMNHFLNWSPFPPPFLSADFAPVGPSDEQIPKNSNSHFRFPFFLPFPLPFPRHQGISRNGPMASIGASDQKKIAAGKRRDRPPPPLSSPFCFKTHFLRRKSPWEKKMPVRDRAGYFFLGGPLLWPVDWESKLPRWNE